MANITLNHKKWSQFLSAVSAYKLFNSSMPNAMMEQFLAPVCTLAFTLGKLYKKPIFEGFHVAIAGAESIDAFSAGQNFRLLSMLLGIEHLKIDLVGPEVNKAPPYIPSMTLKQHIGQNVQISIYEMTIGEYAKRHRPNVIMLNHPGFEAHFNEWFTASEIDYVFDLGIEILGTSYGHDESELDGYFLRAHGYIVSEPENNPYLIDRRKEASLHPLPGIGTEAALAGMMNWAGQVWRIDKKTRQDEELLSLLHDLLSYNDIHALHVPDPAALPLMFDMEDNLGGSWFVVRFHPEPILYSREKAMIVSAEHQEVIAEDVDLDSTYLKPIDKKSPTQSQLISAVINRDYSDLIDEYLADTYTFV